VELSIADSGRSPIQAGYDVIISSNAPSEPGLIARQIAPIPHVICASPRYFQKSGIPSKPENLRDHNCLVNLLSAPKEWPFKSGSRKFLVEVRGTFCSNDATVLTGAAVAGMGIVRVPLYVAQQYLAARKLRSIFESVTTSREQMNAYYSRTKHLPAKTRTFVDFLGDEIRQSLA
jgi:DNA-binding transcriptional LysR family regulator